MLNSHAPSRDNQGGRPVNRPRRGPCIGNQLAGTAQGGPGPTCVEAVARRGGKWRVRVSAWLFRAPAEARRSAGPDPERGSGTRHRPPRCGEEGCDAISPIVRPTRRHPHATLRRGRATARVGQWRRRNEARRVRNEAHPKSAMLRSLTLYSNPLVEVSDLSCSWEPMFLEESGGVCRRAPHTPTPSKPG